MPHNSDHQDAPGEASVAEVVERPAVSSGETIWQAQIVATQGGMNHSGRTRVFTIRGPPRKTRDAAERDAEQLTAASPEGPKAVRNLANTMHRA
mmetsp:Transcript_38541/g.68031  ORF Transcript_38541/g.68031 Transcript_38541/m.68031 type:complete len:94 (+) Transcript_38541:520-801(+)